MHKFDFNWTLKDAQFTKDKGKVFFVLCLWGGRQWDINLPDLTLSDAMR